MAQDCLRALMAFFVCLFIAFIINGTRSYPLPLLYMAPQARLDEAVKRMSISIDSPQQAELGVGVEEMRKISSQHSGIILDARPEIYYRFGHIPSALNLPREDFKNRYLSLQKILGEYQNKRVVVYCAGSNCNDSQMVANALGRLGYQKVQVFRGGWSKWRESKLPEEKQ